MQSEILFPAVLGFCLLLTFLFILSRFYKRATKEVAFVRTGLGGEKVILDGGCLKWPVFHEIIPVNMRTLRLQVDRKNEEGLITLDRMRVDVTAEFYLRVKPESETIAKAAQTLGERTMNPDLLKELLQGKFVDALRAVAAGLSMQDLHEQRADFIQTVQNALSEDLLKNGLELETVSLTALDQTGKEYFKETNAFDAQGLAKLTDITESKREERNRIEQETRIKIETQNLEAEKRSLEIKRAEEFARLDQQRDIDMARAQQGAKIKTEEAERKREAEQARIESERAVREAEIESKRAIDERDIESKRSVEIKNQEASIIVAKKSEEKSKAEAEAAKARSGFVREEENVLTVKETTIAERKKQIELIKAQEEAEKSALGITIAADADKKAAADKAEAVLTEAKAQAEKIKIVAEADNKRLEVEAHGLQAINAAKNILDSKIVEFELRSLIAKIAPEIVKAYTEPMKSIDSIKILQATGFGTGGNGSNGSNGSNGATSSSSLPNQLTDAMLNYRMQLPVIDNLMKELGIDPSSAEGISKLIETAAADPKKSPPANATTIAQERMTTQGAAATKPRVKPEE
ncbi:flotillin domain-containing protein [Pelagicoccus sp. SDUM812003]|uniref:flotillin family protein n=1 Tax=Pelagicoccus sp. SDUM812003 TaxID=3041267 RepID=UPI00280CFF44|nr:flotillin domain-containing protein [Pelagicoccus sp. SDUM812003]MDQ8205394.1 flotillin domain-containing protein [Pelagicoccus sp. SDUM812003]